jgi:hypothetical protein
MLLFVKQVAGVVMIAHCFVCTLSILAPILKAAVSGISHTDEKLYLLSCHAMTLYYRVAEAQAALAASQHAAAADRAAADVAAADATEQRVALEAELVDAQSALEARIG